jgi:hypothetical protein
LIIVGLLTQCVTDRNTISDVPGDVLTRAATSSRRLDPLYDKVKAGLSTLGSRRLPGNARLLARFWISDPSDGRLDVISDINELLLEEFRKNNIRFA